MSNTEELTIYLQKQAELINGFRKFYIDNTRYCQTEVVDQSNAQILSDRQAKYNENMNIMNRLQTEFGQKSQSLKSNSDLLRNIDSEIPSNVRTSELGNQLLYEKIQEQEEYTRNRVKLTDNFVIQEQNALYLNMITIGVLGVLFVGGSYFTYKLFKSVGGG